MQTSGIPQARDTRRSVPASIIGIAIVTGVFYLLVILTETFVTTGISTGAASPSRGASSTGEPIPGDSGAPTISTRLTVFLLTTGLA
jgi:amino acid transporter